MECYLNDPYSNDGMISRMHLIFSGLMRNFYNSIEIFDDDGMDFERFRAGDHASFIDILAYIQKKYQSITLDSLAATFHYNASYLSRIIRNNTRRTLVDIITELRLAKAAELLLRTDLKISAIAEMAGYDSSISHFSRLFRKKYGISPQKYRSSFS